MIIGCYSHRLNPDYAIRCIVLVGDLPLSKMISEQTISQQKRNLASRDLFLGAPLFKLSVYWLSYSFFQWRCAEQRVHRKVPITCHRCTDSERKTLFVPVRLPSKCRVSMRRRVSVRGWVRARYRHVWASWYTLLPVLTVPKDWSSDHVVMRDTRYVVI